MAEILLVISGVFIILSLGSALTRKNGSLTPLDCFRPCAFEGNRVCTTNGTDYKLFTSKCFLDTFNCEEKTNWHPIDPVYCKKKTKKALADCNKNCDNHSAPLCTFDGHTYTLFWNNCWRLESECASGIKYTKVNIENCSHGGTCENTCSKKEKKYVCGSDGKIVSWFRNLCLLELRNCQSHETWIQVPACKCKIKSERILTNLCNQKCASFYDPMCASNNAVNRTFFNVCDMAVYNCLNCSNFKVIVPGRCS